MGLATRWAATFAALFIAGCGTPTQAQHPRPFVVQGRVVDESGQPVARARIVADNQVLYDSNVTAFTAADGRYRISLPRVASTWTVTGTATRALAGSTVEMDLDPDNPEPLAGNEGGVRNFTVRTSGARPEGGSYGASVMVFRPIGAPYAATDVELKFSPLDGGPAFTGQVRNTGDGAAVPDVPVGRYAISATRDGRPMQIRVRNQGAFAPQVSTGFQQVMTGLFQLQLEVQ